VLHFTAGVVVDPDPAYGTVNASQVGTRDLETMLAPVLDAVAPHDQTATRCHGTHVTREVGQLLDHRHGSEYELRTRIID
jgi:hypothetical protein